MHYRYAWDRLLLRCPTLHAEIRTLADWHTYSAGRKEWRLLCRQLARQSTKREFMESMYTDLVHVTWCCAGDGGMHAGTLRNRVSKPAL